MFKILKLYKGQEIKLEELNASLVDFTYSRQEQVQEEGEFARRGEILDIYPVNFEFPIRIRLDQNTVSSINSFNLADGSLLWQHNMVIILPKKQSPSRNFVFKEDMPFANSLDLEKGDYVVHVHHGVGRFLGFEKGKDITASKDCFVLEYENQEKLYVPVDKMYLLQKYVSFEHRRPKLSRLGSKIWLKTKENTKKHIRTLALELLEFQAKRELVKSFKYSKDSSWQRDFENGFGFEETLDQQKAINEVKLDMESGRPMDRLLCGEVGYGKTEVAMRAAFKAVMDDKQVAILVPTTILAEQHFHNFSLRVKDFPVRVEMLSRFRTDAESKRIVEDLKLGKIDIIIGTHSLLADGIIFKDLGLLIIDEEQRFGVEAKEKLKKIKINVNVLTLTATPIPRTLYMSLMGLKDISAIETPPKKRLSVKTYINEFDLNLVAQAIKKELSRNGQVYYVHNRVLDIEEIRNKISSVLPRDVYVEVAHGQMSAKLLEKIIVDFLNNKIQVLLCTNIIESGIDVPNANTLIVDNADDFGLSDLHQLRGRVGRFTQQAYAYFLVAKYKILNEGAQKRLVALQEFAELGSGFKIAMQDLEIRGAGNILGKEQSGFISAVGFDLYCRLLRETVSILGKNAHN
jgi:transcription-repair coupling factor (superfamily II helicase)